MYFLRDQMINSLEKKFEECCLNFSQGTNTAGYAVSKLGTFYFAVLKEKVQIA